MAERGLEMRPLELGEEAGACRLVREVFLRFAAPLYPPEGVEEFLS